MTYFPPAKKGARTTTALSIIVTLILMVIAIVSAIYWFQFWINQPENNEILVLGAINFTSIVATLMNTVTVVVSDHTFLLILSIIDGL